MIKYIRKNDNRLLTKVALVPNGNIQVPNDISLSYIIPIYDKYNEDAFFTGSSALYISPKIGLIGKELMDINTGDCYFLEIYLLQLDKTLEEIKNNLKGLELTTNHFNANYNFLKANQNIICGILYSCPAIYNNTQVTQKEQVIHFPVTNQQLKDLDLILNLVKAKLKNNQNLEFIN